MDISGGLSLAQFVIEKLSSPVWNRIEDVLGLESQLDKLRESISTIEAVLLDAEEQEQLQQYRCSRVERNRLQRLKTALYRADDLVDEIVTVSNLKELRPCNKNRLCNEVCLFCSRQNQFRSAFTWSREMEKINEMLDDIVKDHRFDFVSRHPAGFNAKQMKIIARETHSHVCEDDVFIGRDDVRRKVIDMLVNTGVEQQDGFVVSIVGIGGLGKTTLAREVFNDKMIVEKFPRKLWVCVSVDFSITALVSQILTAANPEFNQDNLKLEELQKELRKELDGKKCLLVLDDVWNDDPSNWTDLRNLLIGDGSRVSRVLVTTRSENVATVVESRWTHKLEGLSYDDSLDLFLKMAVKKENHPVQQQLVDIGSEIVKKCPKVPLAIKAVGSLLRGQDEQQWENLKNTDWVNIIQEESNGIVPVLKISYNYLPFYLKSCFSYCAVFPKDYEIDKEDLIRLWMAQGFIMPSTGESFEDAGEKYFKQLLQRCFFQDVKLAEGTTNEIVSCKMHDLIHDLAMEVAGTDILSCTYSSRCFNEKTRHVFLDKSTPNDLLGKLTNMQRIRTFLCVDYWLPSPKRTLFVKEVSKMKYLRVLGLNGLGLKLLPSLVGELVHLRYLDLSKNYRLDVLPSSITKLYNLQTLKLRQCWSLICLPRELRKLVNLRHLDISGCSDLTHMPRGMNKMTSLQKLTGFVVSGSGRSNAGWNWSSTGVGQLEDLDNFTNHTSSMKITVKKNVRYNTVGGEGMLFKIQKLREVIYNWEPWNTNNAEELLRGLQPHANLRKLVLEYYPGVKFPNWMMTLSCRLQKLVQIEIIRNDWIEHLPLMSQLRHLKVLKLLNLSKVEYVESSSNINGGDEDDELVFFPSLENLWLWSLPKLKGLWKSESRKGETPQAPMLSLLEIRDCPNLTTFPFCPELQQLTLFNVNEAMGPIMRETTQQKEEGRYGGLREMEIDNVAYLNSLPIHSFHHLSELQILHNDNIERIGEVGDVFRSGRLSSLRSLVIFNCTKLKSITGRGVWEHFTALESLRLGNLRNLEMEDEDDVNNGNMESTGEGCITNNEGSDDAEMPWRYLAPTLRSLILWDLPKMVKLPKGIGCLSSLHSLSIQYCRNMESLTPSIGCLSSLQSLRIIASREIKTMPEEMRHLTSLAKLEIHGCSPELEKRCEKHTGVDWPNIQHIPAIKIT